METDQRQQCCQFHFVSNTVKICVGALSKRVMFKCHTKPRKTVFRRATWISMALHSDQKNLRLFHALPYIFTGFNVKQNQQYIKRWGRVLNCVYTTCVTFMTIENDIHMWWSHSQHMCHTNIWYSCVATQPQYMDIISKVINGKNSYCTHDTLPASLYILLPTPWTCTCTTIGYILNEQYSSIDSTQRDMTEFYIQCPCR